MTDIGEPLSRTALLVGESGIEIFQNAFVAVVGLGGVGGHCAEALARAGVGRLLLIDCDTVQPSNRNRQQFATKSTIGQQKTRAAAERISEVSDCRAETLDLRIDADTIAQLPEELSFIVDAIDQLSGKLALVGFANAHRIPIVSCMGAGNRLDASRFRVRDVFETQNCPLARRMRQALRKMGVAALPVVSSDESAVSAPGQRVIGSLAPVTGAAGLVAASYVLNTLLKFNQD